MREAFEGLEKMTRASTARLVLLLGLVVPLACSEDDDRVVSGRYLDVTLPADVEICGGTLDGYDRFIEATATRWGTELEGWRAEMMVLSPGELADECTRLPNASCTLPAEGRAWLVRTEHGEHEIVHPVTGASESAFLSEGTATHWGIQPFRWTLERDDAAAMVESRTGAEFIDASGTGYLSAGVFAASVIRAFGIEGYRELYQSIPVRPSFADFDRVFAMVDLRMRAWAPKLSAHRSGRAARL